MMDLFEFVVVLGIKPDCKGTSCILPRSQILSLKCPQFLRFYSATDLRPCLDCVLIFDLMQFPPAQQMMPQSLMATRSSVMYGQSPLSGMHAQLGNGNGQDAVTTTMGVGASGGFPDLGGGGRGDGGAL